MLIYKLRVQAPALIANIALLACTCQHRASDRKGMELAMSVKAVFEGAIMLELYPRSQIDLYLHVIQVSCCSSKCYESTLTSGTTVCAYFEVVYLRNVCSA
jgi:hypothetical protein